MLLVMAPVSQCPSAPCWGLQAVSSCCAQSPPKGQGRPGTLSFLPSPGASFHPKTPTLTLGWGSELPGCGRPLLAPAGSHSPPPAGLSLEQSLPPHPRAG